MLGGNKVIWKEGMYLQPQHFQQAERHIFDQSNTRLQLYFSHYYGLTEIAIDKDALANNLFTLTRCSGVLPDGTSFDMPKKMHLSAPRSFSEHFSHELQSLDVFLALPVAIEGKDNVGLVGGETQATVRYRSKAHAITDEVFGGQKKEIDLGDYNFVTLFGDESQDNYSVIPIGKLVRNPEGRIVLKDKYIPPLLHISGSSYLMELIRGLLELLLAKISSLSQGRRQIEGGFAEFGSKEETAFRLLQTLNTFTPLLNHSHMAPRIHPYDLFALLTQFAGALCTFSSQVAINNLPRYDHQNLTATFERFAEIMRAVLGADISAGSVPFPIQQIKPSTYVAQGPDPKLLSTAKFYFGFSANAPEKELIVNVLQTIKISSPDKLDILISSAMPGVQLMHTSHLPEKLPTKPGFLYFTFDQQSELWHQIRAVGAIGFYFPHTFTDLQMEIVALKQ
ncbi:MAG: type VI secretion system baseplate subunit TssK [Chitinivibrionales bacterium]|nr:type VI secretion system baseplate subunit TssK [Chitinivibrionales bacterium]